MKKIYHQLILSLFVVLPLLGFSQGSGHGAAAAYITTATEPWGQTSNISALNAVYGSGWNKYIYGADANGNVSNIFSNTRSLVFIEGGDRNTTAMRNFLDANWSTIDTWVRGGRTLIISAATNESLGKFQIGSSGVYSERILTNNMVAFSSASTYPNTASNVHPLLRTNVTINGVTGDAYFSGNYYGNYVAHNVITGTGLNSIFTVSGTTNQYTLAEKTIGSGRMLVGGLTLPWFITVQSWQPQPQMTRLMYAMLGWVQAVSNPAPSIITSNFTNLGTTSVTTGGSSINANGETITAKGVAYSTSQNPTTSSSTVSGGSGTANFSVNITNLTPNTLYYARAYATSPTGTGYGNQISFRTLPLDPTNATSSAGTTICSGSFTNLSVSNAQGTVYWYTDASMTNFVGTGNPRSVNPSVSTTYYAWNYNGNFSTGNTSIAITVQQPASQPATANVVVPASADGLTTANLSWSQSTGDGTITYYWSVGQASTSSYESGYTARGTTPTITATAAGLTKSTAYYLSVKAVNNCGTSVYRRSAIFRTNNERIYQAGANGTVGTTSAGGQSSLAQYTAYNTNGSAVFAVPNSGYNFVNWSDGNTSNPRTDASVTTSATLTANFAPNRLAFVTQPITKRAGETIPVSVRITDTYGSTMTNATANITLAIEANPSIGAAGVIAGTVTVAAVDGVATFNDLWINKTGNGYTLKASSPSPIVTQPVSSAFNIIPAADVNYFTLEGITTPHEAGAFTSPTVTAYDVYDNVKYDYTGTITFSTNNVSLVDAKPTIIPGAYTFQTSDNGIKTFTNQVNLKRYGSGYWVRVIDGSAQGEQTNIQVTSAPLNFYTIIANADVNGNQQDVKAGTPFTVLAKLYDEFGNQKLDFTGGLDVTFTTNANPSPLGNPAVIPSAGNRTFTAGVCTISGFTFYNAQETPTITIVESMTGSAGTTPAITVWPEVLANFLVQEQPVQNHGIGGIRVTSNENFSLKVTARDQYNNIKRDYVGNINFKSSNDNIVDYPLGLQAFTAGHQGVRTFGNIRIPTTGAYWLRVADSPDAFKTGTLENIVVGPGDEDENNSELYFTSYPSDLIYPPTNVIAGDYIAVTLKPRDDGQNLLCDCQNVIFYLNGVDKHRTGTPVLGVPALETIDVTDHHDGSYTALIRVTDMSQTNYITASVNGTSLNTTLQVIINEPAAPSLLVSTLNAASNTITTDQSTLITLQLKDEFANNRMSNDGTMSFSTTLGGFGTNNGTMEINAAYLGGTTGTYIATLYASYSAVNHGVGNAAITVSANFSAESHTDGNFDDNEIVAITEGLPNLATSTITANPTEITTDESSLITLQLKDHLGNLIQNNRGVATLISDVLGELSATTYLSNGQYVATLSGDVRPINGVGTAIITGSFAGVGTASEVTGYFNDGGSPSNNTVATVRITQGLPDVATIQIVADPTTMTTDESSIITVTLFDHLGNLIINSRGTVVLTTTLGAISTVTDNDNGTYTATLTGNATGTGNATISGTIVIDNIGNPVAIIDNAQVTITEGLPNLLTSTITASHSSITTDGSSVITVQLKDQFGNNIVNNRGAVIISTDLGALSSTSYDSHGKYIATLTGNNTGTGNATLSATLNIDNGGTAAAIDDTETVSITEGLPALSQIEITASPVEITADETSTITVQLKDQWGNLLTTSRGTITLATNPIGVVSAVTDNSNGTYTAIFSLNAYGTGAATITGQLSGEVVGSIADNATVEVSHGVATQLAIDTQPSTYVRAGDVLAQQPVISIRDVYGNLVDDNTTQITASAIGSAHLVGIRTITATNGLVSYSGLNYEKMEQINIAFASDPVLTSATSNGITVDHNKTYRFEFTTEPAFIIAGGQRGAYAVKRYDAYNNLVNNVVNSDGTDNTTAETVYLFTSMAEQPVAGTFHNALAAGSVITTIDIANNATSANFWYFSQIAGNHLITGSDVTPLDNPDTGVINAVHNTLEVRPAALSHFIVSGVGTSVGSGWTEHYYGEVQTVTVEAIDIFGNRKTNYTGKITFNLTDAQAAVSTNYPVDYTFTAGDGAGLDNGIHTFTNSILFTRPSFEHPDYPVVNEWWVTAVDMAQPSKYGSQVKIKVLRRPITIVANNQTKYYYGETHNLGTTSFTVTSDLANIYAYNQSVTSAALNSAGTVNTATVGDYAIVPGNATGINNFNPDYYSINYVNGTLTVEPRPITIATAGTQSKTYGDMDPSSYGYSITSAIGLTAWDQWSGVLTRASGENVGWYNMLINESSLTIVETANPGVNKADNYDISFVNTNQFEITRKPITLTPVASQEKTYGDVNPTYAYTTNPAISSLLDNGLTVSLTGALTREDGEDVGLYEILQGNVDNTENPNYSVTFNEDVWFTINRLPILVTTNTGQTKVYGQLDPLPFSFTANPAIGHELANGLFVELNGTLSREAGENVGLYAIQQNTVNNTTNPNYDVSYSGSNFEITRRPITVTAFAEQYKTYGDLDPIFAYTTTVDAIGSTLPNGHIVSLIGALTRDAGEVVDLYNILQGTITNTTNPNYNINFTDNVLFEIKRLSILVTVNSGQIKTYGELDPLPFTYTADPVIGHELANGLFVELNGTLSREAGENVGLYAIQQNTVNNTTNPNYDVSYSGSNFEITRRPITVTAVAEQYKTYGDLDPIFAYTTTLDAIGSTLPNGHIVSLIGALTRDAGEVVDLYNILQGTITNTTNPNYNINFTEDVLFEIKRLSILVTANSGQIKTYGELDPLPFTFTADPVIGHELANGLFVELNGTLSREAGENVGLYAIQQNTVNNTTNPNYDVSYSGSNFEITRRPITVIAVAEQYKTYGDLDPIFAYTTTLDAIGSTLPNGHIVSLIGALTRDAGEVVDLYNILQGTITNTTNPNYNITITPEVKFEIERKDIAIYVSGDQSKIYGENNPTYAYTTTPALGDLPFNAAFVGALVRQPGENVASNYTITQGTLELGDDNNGLTSLSQNYNVSFTGADFEITRKAIAITVTADQQKVYGETDPAFAFTTVPALASLPFQAASWSGELIREVGEVVGDDYTITRGTLELIDGQNSDGNSLATNYAVTFTPADFEITRKPITITVDAVAKTYGDNDPDFTFDSSPLLASLPFNAAWTGNLVRLNTNENVAAYAITQGSLELTDNNNGMASLAQNYTLNFVGNNLTINKRNITIMVASDQQKVYAETDPVFTYSSSVDPLYFGGSFTGALSRAGGENVADYAIGRGTLQIVDNNNVTSLDANYNLNFVAANFAITKKPITITVVEGQNKRYGFNDPVSSPAAPTYFRDYEFVSSVNPLPFGGNFIGTLQRTGVSSSPVGSYPINRGTLNINDTNNNTTSLDANYQITFAGSNFTINERLLTISASDQSKTYGFGPEWGVGQPDYWTLGSTDFSVSTIQGDGLAYSETITGVQFSSAGETRFAFVGDYGVSIVAGSAIGTNGFALSNYQFSYEGAELTILHRILNLSNFAADNKFYDGNTTATGLGFNDNRVPGDNLAFTRTAAFENADAGAGKTVVYNSVIISGGAHKDNYVLETETSHWKTPANRKIDPKPLSITANTFTKYLGELYTFTGDEFQTSEMVTGETIQSVSLQSAGSPVGASIGSYNIEISNPIAAAGTLLTNYEIELHNGLMHVVDPMTIAGKVFYYQKFSFIGGTPVRQDLPMQGVTVKLHHTGGVSTTTTSIDGGYTFTQVNPSTVTKVEVESNLPWGSVSANDALAMQLKLVQTPPTYWTAPFNIDFMDYIADVNNSGNLTIQDVLGTKYRILYPGEFTFPAGNWRFYAEDLNFVPLNRESDNSASLPNPIMNGGFYPNIYARVVGDMDGDFNPNPSKSLIPIQEGEAVVVSSGELFGLDIQLKDVLDFAAMSLTLQFDENKVQVESVSSTLSGYEYRIEGNEIRVVWTSLSGLTLNANDLLLTLNMRTIAPVYWYDNILFMNSNTVFGDMFAEMIGNVAIVAPHIDNTVTDLTDFDANQLSLRAYPNPFNDWVNLSYTVPAQSEISINLVDMMGVTVKELLNKEHLTGTYTYRLSAKQLNLAMGVYHVRMHVVANGKSYVRIQRLVHID